MFKIVEDMRNGNIELVKKDVRIEPEAMEIIERIMQEQDLTVSEVITCVFNGDIITYPDGTYDINE